LVIQPLPGIGDMIWHLPFIQAIARQEPEGAITLLTKRRSFADQLLSGDPAVRSVLWLDRNGGEKRHDGISGAFRLSRDLAHHRFRRVWILHHSPRYALAALLAGIPERYGFGLGAQRLWLNDSVHLPAALKSAHPIDKATAYLALKDVPIPDPIPRLTVDPEKRARTEAALDMLPRPWVALGIGCSMAEKQWGGDNFVELVKASQARFGGTMLALGAEFDAPIATQITAAAADIQGHAISILGRPLDEIGALLSLCDLYVGNDTGLLNVAAATGIPAIGLIGLSISERLADPCRGIHALFPPGGTSGDATGVRAITPTAVLDSMERFLGNT